MIKNLTPGDGVSQVAWGWWVDGWLRLPFLTLAIYETWVVVSNIFCFHPENWGRFPIWRAYFSKGLKPPTRSLSLPVFQTDFEWDWNSQCPTGIGIGWSRRGFQRCSLSPEPCGAIDSLFVPELLCQTWEFLRVSSPCFATLDAQMEVYQSITCNLRPVHFSKGWRHLRKQEHYRRELKIVITCHSKSLYVYYI